MSLDPQIFGKKADELLSELKKTSPKSIGNKTLMNTLKLDYDDFFEVRDYLFNKGLVSKAMGKGGATVLVQQSIEKTDIEMEKEIETAKKSEQALYEPLKKTLKEYWAKDNGFEENLVIEVTANQGRRQTGGKWSRPDIVIVAKKTYVYLKSTTLDVISFEIKPKGFLEDKTGVFETASHSLFANKSYLLLHCNKDQNADDVEDVAVLCKQFGIGLILFSNAGDYSTFNTIVEPERKSPDYGKIDEFIKIQLSELAKEKILHL